MTLVVNRLQCFMSLKYEILNKISYDQMPWWHKNELFREFMIIFYCYFHNNSRSLKTQYS